MRKSPEWPERCVALLRQMWAAGSSAGEIANALGGRFSRNAVLGKVDRLGLMGTRPKKAKDALVLEGKITAVKRMRNAPPKPLRGIVPPRPPLPAPPPPASCPPAPDSAPITILDLTSKTCRWPLERNDDGERLFCGADVGTLDRHRRYCNHHRSRELQRAGRAA